MAERKPNPLLALFVVGALELVVTSWLFQSCGTSVVGEERSTLGAPIMAGVAPRFLLPQSPRPSVFVPSRGLDFDEEQALRPSSRLRQGASVMLYEAADLAAAFRSLGSTCRTPAAIRARVRTGYMSPDDHTPRGGALWTAEGLQRELLHEARLIHRYGPDTSRRLQRWYQREAVQLELSS